MEPKILFLDLDGTLLNDQKEVTQGNRLAIERALELGHKIVIASGRPLKSALVQAGRLDLTRQDCYVIAYNGGIVYDCFQQKEIYRKTLELEDVYTVFDEANRRGVHIQTYENEAVVVERRNDTETVRKYCEPTQMDYRVIRDIRQELREPPVKTLVIDFEDHAPLEDMKRWINEHMHGKMDCFFSSRYLLEIVPAGMNKGRAVTDLCRKLRIPIENAVAAGDEANDISMLRAAGIGAAMENAVPEVKAAADYVTQRDNNHDGIAEIIERFILS